MSTFARTHALASAAASASANLWPVGTRARWPKNGFEMIAARVVDAAFLHHQRIDKLGRCVHTAAAANRQRRRQRRRRRRRCRRWTHKHKHKYEREHSHEQSRAARADFCARQVDLANAIWPSASSRAGADSFRFVRASTVSCARRRHY